MQIFSLAPFSNSPNMYSNLLCKGAEYMTNVSSRYHMRCVFALAMGKPACRK